MTPSVGSFAGCTIKCFSDFNFDITPREIVIKNGSVSEIPALDGKFETPPPGEATNSCGVPLINGVLTKWDSSRRIEVSASSIRSCTQITRSFPVDGLEGNDDADASADIVDPYLSFGVIGKDDTVSCAVLDNDGLDGDTWIVKFRFYEFAICFFKLK